MYDEMVEQLYDLDRKELRRLAYEALLISDGPEHIDGDIKGVAIIVRRTGKSGSDSPAFRIWEK